MENLSYYEVLLFPVVFFINQLLSGESQNEVEGARKRGVEVVRVPWNPVVSEINQM